MAEQFPIQVRLKKNGKPSIIHWQGLLCGSSRFHRGVTFGVLTLATLSLSFMQFGFVGVGAEGGFAVYGVALLAPVALTSLLLGVWLGTLMGFASGAILYLHAQYQPLDYYEVNYITPLSSIFLFTVTAFFLGLLLAIALRKNPPTWRRIVYMALLFSFSSVMFTTAFTSSVLTQLIFQIIEKAMATGAELDEATARVYALTMLFQMGNIFLQVWLDASLMFVVCVIADIAVRRALAAQGNFSLLTKFRGWLLLVVSSAFLVTAGFGFVVVTEQAKEAAEANMRDEINYLITQLKSYEERSASLGNFLESEQKTVSAMGENEARDLEKAFSIDELLNGYNKENDGTIVVIEDGIILLSDDPEYEVGNAARDYSGNEELQKALDGDSAGLSGMVQTTYDERLLLAEDMENEEVFDSSEITTQIVFMSFGTYDDYTIMMIMPASKVFSGRNTTMAWTTLSAFVLLLVMFILVSHLLNSIVVRRIDETNGVLGEITEGDLDARVDIRDSREFASLSTGINTTVNALKDSIAEAESRMDAELATAKEIQEAALPQVFPPYPDILKFDIYATMNAAREVGGDFYDFFLIGEDAGPDEGKLGFVIADVSGKGVPAALFMMKAKTQIRDYLMSGMEPGEAVENANRQLCDGNEAGMFVTAWIGVLDYLTGRIDYVNAGHNPPLLWSFADGESADDGAGPEREKHPQSGSWHWLTEKSGLPLGLFEGLGYETFSVECRPGDQFLLYTDGVTEAMNVEGELYGEGRLMEIVSESVVLHPRALVEAVRHSVAAHAAGAEQSDDTTVLALEVGVPPEVTAILTVPADVDELSRVNKFIHTELDRRLCPLRAQKQLDVAVEELFVNVAHYAYPDADKDNPGMVRISYTYSTDPPSVRVDIADDGIPYNPLAKPDAVTPDDIMDVPIGGLGILMAKRSVDDMTYERVGESNVVSITKKW